MMPTLEMTAGRGDALPSLSLSAVAPCYDEAGNLAELHRRLSAACSAVVGDDYELILVNDRSQDATWHLLTELVAADRHVVAVDLSRNYGHELALTAGLSLARGERILVLDADLQDPPELLVQMMAALDEGADLVYGRRVSRTGEPWWKRATSAMFYRVLRSLTDVEIPLDAGDFRLMTRRVLEAFLAMPEQHRFVRGMVSWTGFKQVPLDYDRAERVAGVTKYPLRKLMRLAFDAITGFSIRPLRIANYLSVLLAFCAFATLGYVFYSWWVGTAIPGWTSVMTVVLLLGSFQMLVLGIMCEYLGRLFVEAKRRPLFLIDQVIRGTDPPPNSPIAPDRAA